MDPTPSRRETVPGKTAPAAGTDRSLHAILQRIEALPSLPSVANAILDQVLSQDFDHAKLARIIETDQALTLKILDHANSATYISRGIVSQVEQGLNRLGSRVVQTLMLSVLIKDSLITGDRNGEAAHKALWRHCLATAVYASLIAGRSYPSLAVEAFGAGIMHDLGRIFLQLHVQEEYVHVTERMEELYEAVLDAEQEVFKTDHTAVGRWIAQKWKLPPSMTDVIWLHHHSAPALGAMKGNGPLVAIVALANILAHFTLMDAPRSMSREKQRQIGLQDMLGLGEKEIQDIHRAFAPCLCRARRALRPGRGPGDSLPVLPAEGQPAAHAHGAGSGAGRGPAGGRQPLHQPGLHGGAQDEQGDERR